MEANWRADPILEQALTYWLRCRGDRAMPRRRDIDPTDIPKLLPHLQLVEPVGVRFRYRLHGTALVEAAGRDQTGAFLDEIAPGLRAEMIGAVYRRVTRSYAMTLWDTPTFWTYVDRALDAKGLSQAYGYAHSEDRIITHMPTWRGDYDVLFLSMSRDTLIQNVASLLEETSTGFSRSMDTHMVKSSPPVDRQARRSE